MNEDLKIDLETMGKLGKALVFICGTTNPAIALKAAAESGTPADIKKARTLFLKLKPGERRSAFEMIAG
jgi:hypothetical protein